MGGMLGPGQKSYCHCTQQPQGEDQATEAQEERVLQTFAGASAQERAEKLQGESVSSPCPCGHGIGLQERDRS